MVSVMEVSARLDEFIRTQEIANASFAPDRAHQDIINTVMRERVDELEAKVVTLEDQDLARGHRVAGHQGAPREDGGGVAEAHGAGDDGGGSWLRVDALGVGFRGAKERDGWAQIRA